jgi:hypothetical protein
MDDRKGGVMRVIGALFVAVVMYIAVPLLWQRAMVAKVNEISANESNFPTSNELAVTNFTFDENVINAINPTVTINTEEYEAIAIRSQADDTMRQAQHAQDMAYDATH